MGRTPLRPWRPRLGSPRRRRPTPRQPGNRPPRRPRRTRRRRRAPRRNPPPRPAQQRTSGSRPRLAQGTRRSPHPIPRPRPRPRTHRRRPAPRRPPHHPRHRQRTPRRRPLRLPRPAAQRSPSPPPSRSRLPPRTRRRPPHPPPRRPLQRTGPNPPQPHRRNPGPPRTSHPHHPRPIRHPPQPPPTIPLPAHHRNLSPAETGDLPAIRIALRDTPCRKRRLSPPSQPSSCGRGNERDSGSRMPQSASNSPSPDLQEFELGKREPTISLLENMATAYKTAFTSLLLLEPPALPDPPRDFRTFDGAPPQITPELRFAFVRTHEDREIATELASELELPVEADIAGCRLGDDIGRIAAHERARLGVNSAAQLASKGPTGHFGLWRGAVEHLGVLVFSRRFDPRSCRGFSNGGDGLLPAITASSQDSPAARTFTLLHEYAHLMLGDPGMCGDLSARSSRLEAFCNELAAAMLMPPDLVDKVRPKDAGQFADSQAIRAAARKLRVSASAAAIRFATLGLATTAVKEEVLKRRQVGASGGRGPEAQRRLHDAGPQESERAGRQIHQARFRVRRP